MVSGLYLGLLSMFLIFAIGLRLGFPDFLMNLYIVQQATGIIWSLVVMGYARQYSDSWFGLDSFDRPASWITIVYGFLLCLFRLAFLSQFPFRGRTKLLIYVPLCIYVPIFTLMALGYDSWALGINALTVTVTAVLSMLLVLFAIDWKSYTVRLVPRWLVTFFFVFFGFATPFATSVVLWGEQAPRDPIGPLLFIAVASGALMSTLLFYRARSMANHLMASQLESKLLLQRSQERAKFSGMLAHEIKTPLSILSWVASSGQLDNRYTTYSQQAISNIDSVLEKCLQAESIIDNEVVSQAVLLDVESLVHDVVTSVGGTDIVEISCAGEMKTYSDPALVQVVLTNLVENALKYGKCDAPIKVSLISDARQIIRVRVASAIGSAGAPDVSRVFEKYYRGSLASSEPGSGLGLYLSKHISKLLGGDLICQLGEKEIWFEFSLPLSK
ncbi:MAG TPA: HAMP domain-containing sensor histidine kinase [Orrella sp.]